MDGCATARTPFGISLGVGAATMVGACATAAALFPPGDVTPRLLVVAGVVAAFTAGTDSARASLATAGLGFLLFDGFLVQRYGELTWDDTSSLWHLMGFAAAVGLGLAWRWLRLAWVRAAVDAELDELVSHPKKRESHGA